MTTPERYIVDPAKWALDSARELYVLCADNTRDRAAHVYAELVAYIHALRAERDDAV